MSQDNPLLHRTSLPAFDKIRPEHIKPAVSAFLGEGAKLLTAAEVSAPGDWNGVMTPLGEIDLLFEYGWSPVSHLLGVANSED